MYYVYILTNNYNKVLYIGVTNNLLRRTQEHIRELNSGFTQKYNAKKLVYFETFEHMNDAIAREKYLKGKKRQTKIALIEEFNPEWKDLFSDSVDGTLHIRSGRPSPEKI